MMPYNRFLPILILLALGLLAAACGPATGSPTPTLPAPSATALPPTATATSEPTATATQTPRPTPTPIPPSPTPVVDVYNYVQNCDAIDHLVSTYERQAGLEGLRFDTQLSAAAQARLELPVLVEPSCNVKLDNVPFAVVIHATRGGLVGSIAEFQERNSTSAHYIIDRDGQVYQMVPEELVAYHVTCCTAQFGQVKEDYRQSIGIELVNKLYVNPDGFDSPIYEDFMESFGYRYWEDYPEAQIASLIVLIDDITNRWGISMDHVVGHYQVNDTVDPGPALNLFWQRNGNPSRPPIFPNP
jgi:hypothetical protein